MKNIKVVLGQKVSFLKSMKKIDGKYTEVVYDKPINGIIVGVRTVHNGTFETEYSDFGGISKYWINTLAIPIVLVATNLKSFEKVKREDLIIDP